MLYSSSKRFGRVEPHRTLTRYALLMLYSSSKRFGRVEPHRTLAMYALLMLYSSSKRFWKSRTTSNKPLRTTACVVSSFTERKLHPHLQPCVTTILIHETQFHVILYHCEKDILLVSEPIDLETRGNLSQSAMTVLWVVLNHRYA